jgi:hypothetical protein
MKIGILRVHLLLSGCKSLKEKRGRLQPLLKRLHQEYNVSVAELDLQDTWQESVVGCALINNNPRLIHSTFEKIKKSIESFYTEIELTEDQIEIL